MFYDYTIQETDLTRAERTILTRGQIPTYWYELKKTKKDNYYKKRNRFRDLVNLYGKQNIQETIGNLITQKWDELLQPDPKTLQELTAPANMDVTGINRSSIGLKPVNSFQEEDESARPLPGRYCRSCKRDISHQRLVTKFCSAKFV